MYYIKNYKADKCNIIKCLHCVWALRSHNPIQTILLYPNPNLNSNPKISGYNNGGRVDYNKHNSYGVTVLRGTYLYSFSIITTFHTINDNDIEILMECTKKFIKDFLVPNKMDDYRILINRGLKKMNIKESELQFKEHLHLFVIMNSEASEKQFDNFFRTNNGVWDIKYLHPKKTADKKPYGTDFVINLDNEDVFIPDTNSFTHKLDNLIKKKSDKSLTPQFFIFLNFIKDTFQNGQIALA